MMILVKQLTKLYGPVVAVDHVSFQVDKGEVVGFLGPNGAGKSTTMRILTTYLPATSGMAVLLSRYNRNERMGAMISPRGELFFNQISDGMSVDVESPRTGMDLGRP